MVCGKITPPHFMFFRSFSSLTENKTTERKPLRMYKLHYFTRGMENGRSRRQNVNFSLPVFVFSSGQVRVHLTIWWSLSWFLSTLKALVSHGCVLKWRDVGYTVYFFQNSDLQRNALSRAACSQSASFFSTISLQPNPSSVNILLNMMKL